MRCYILCILDADTFVPVAGIDKFADQVDLSAKQLRGSELFLCFRWSRRLHCCQLFARHCAQPNQNYVQLRNVKYGRSGAFAINMWIKPTSLQGTYFSYVYSHNTSAPAGDLDPPNQVHIHPHSSCPALSFSACNHAIQSNYLSMHAIHRMHLSQIRGFSLLKLDHAFSFLEVEELPLTQECLGALCN